MTARIPPDPRAAPELRGDQEEQPRSRNPRRSFLAGACATVAGSVLAVFGEGTRSVLPPGRTGSAGASPSSGFSRSGLGRGVLTRAAPIDLQEGTDVIFDSVTIAPGGATGWHTHPGPELLVVTEGVLTFQRSDGVTCVTEQVSAGQAFVGAAPGELHAAHNEGADPTEFVVAFFNIPTGGPSRGEGDPPPVCP